MREILFRAKRTSNARWVEGYFFKDDEKTTISDRAIQIITSIRRRYANLPDSMMQRPENL